MLLAPSIDKAAWGHLSNDMILTTERTRLPGDGPQQDRRIGKAVIFAPEDELRVRQFTPDDIGANAGRSFPP